MVVGQCSTLPQRLCLLLATFSACAVVQGRPASHQLAEQRYNPENRDLKKVLEKVAINNEVLACVSNSALIVPGSPRGPLLKYFIESAQWAGVKNFLVVAIDDQTAEACEQLGVAYWRKDPKFTKEHEISSHGISALKFQLVKEFLVLNYSVLLSDVDVLTLKNPFDYMYRDEDLEVLSDGYDSPTAYGFDDILDDPKMGWSRQVHSIRVFHLNSGLFYARPSNRTIKLMDRITKRLNRERAWDQAVFNEEILLPSHDGYHTSHCSVRIMNIDKFVNSKRLFVTMRKDKRYANHMPVMVHVNYHVDKLARMQAVYARYINGTMDALDHLPVWSFAKGLRLRRTS